MFKRAVPAHAAILTMLLTSLLLQDSLRLTQSQLSEAREAFEVTAADNHVMAAKLAEVRFVTTVGQLPTLCISTLYPGPLTEAATATLQLTFGRRETVRQRCSLKWASLSGSWKQQRLRSETCRTDSAQLQTRSPS